VLFHYISSGTLQVPFLTMNILQNHIIATWHKLIGSVDPAANEIAYSTIK